MTVVAAGGAVVVVATLATVVFGVIAVVAGSAELQEAKSKTAAAQSAVPALCMMGTMDASDAVHATMHGSPVRRLVPKDIGSPSY